MSAIGSFWPVWWMCVGLLGLLGPLAAWAQAPVEPPRTGAEALGQEMARFGASWSEYQRIKTERRTRIAELQQQKARCGGCADAARLDEALRSLQAAEGTMARIEADTLQGLGLTSYGQSFDELAAAFVKGLSAKHDFGTQHTFERIGDVITAHCGGRAKASGVPITSTAFIAQVRDCAMEQNQHRQLMTFSGALRLCQTRMGDNFAALCRSGERCDAFEACMAENSQAVALCRDNVARQLQPPMSRCFAHMLRPELFTGAGSEDRPARRQRQREEIEARKQAHDEDRQAARCATIARQVERQREAYDGKHSNMLDRAEARYARECGGR